MRPSWIALLVLLAPRALAQECPAPSGLDELLMDPVAALAAELEPVFIGCRPSPGECVASCPDRQASWALDPEQCDLHGPEPYACSCLVEGEPTPEEPPEGAVYVGCRPSLGECVNSCPTRNAWGTEDPGSCPPELGEGSVACYCL